MKVLIVPMAAMAETSGSFSRTVILADSLIKSDIDVAVCAAEDLNYKPIYGVKKYGLSLPMPLGLPSFIAKHTFPVAQKLGITSRKSVKSFEEVLYLTGNITYKYLKKSVLEIRKAIQDYNPDVVYSEYNISAIIAAKLENKKLFISTSMPTQCTYASSPKYAKGTNKILKENQLPTVTSTLELFSLADGKFVPSCYELEPFKEKDVTYCGAWKQKEIESEQVKNVILVYMGNGTIPRTKMVKEVTKAFENSQYQVYIAGMGLEKKDFKNIHIAPYFNFTELLPKTLLFINHGGQNSIIDGLIYGVPQLICPGKVFERKFNAESMKKNHAGAILAYKDFSAVSIRRYGEQIISNEAYRNNAEKLGHILLTLGGTKELLLKLKYEAY